MYDTAQICENGHVVNSSFRAYPQFNTDHCEQCGAKTIHTCPLCGKDIRGRYMDSMSLSEFPAPAHCNACGAPYPWTTNAMEAYRDLLGLAANLTDEERGKLSIAIDDLITDTPRTQTSAVRVKLALQKVAPEVAQG
ncbi:MAG: DUF2321 domain-containing protein, partial [Chloroflexi bacterium]